MTSKPDAATSPRDARLHERWSDALGRGLGPSVGAWLIGARDLTLEALSGSIETAPSAELVAHRYAEERERRALVNVARIVAVALGADREHATDEAADTDWLGWFFEHARHVAHPRTQQLWGAILAQEVARPGSVSLRTLDLLRSCRHREIDALEGLLSATFDDGSFFSPVGQRRSALPHRTVALAPEALAPLFASLGVEADAMARLDELGLLRSPSNGWRTFDLFEPVVLPRHDVSLRLARRHDALDHLAVPAGRLSPAGIEVARAVRAPVSRPTLDQTVGLLAGLEIEATIAPV